MSIKDEECLFLPRCGAAVGDPGEVVSRPPTLGEHTDRVLADLGYDAEAIAALRKGGIIRPVGWAEARSDVPTISRWSASGLAQASLCPPELD